MRLVVIFIAICIVVIVLSEITVRQIERNGMTDTLTADKFLEVTRNSKSISVAEDMSNGGLIVIVRYHPVNEEDEIVKNWQGPDPNTTEYAVYIKFLAELYSIPGLQNFVTTYINRQMRRLGRMTT